MHSPVTQALIVIIQGILSGFYLLYLASAWVIDTCRAMNVPRESRIRRGANLAWSFSKWPALARLILDPFFMYLTDRHMSAPWWFCELASFYIWWIFRDHGDHDDWKRMRDAVRGRVAVRKGKLIVVTETA